MIRIFNPNQPPSRSAFNVHRLALRTRMRARLDSGDLDAVDPGRWRREAEIFVERELDCAISTPAEELVASSEMASTAQYLCTIREDFCLAGYESVHLCLWRCRHNRYKSCTEPGNNTSVR